MYELERGKLLRLLVVESFTFIAEVRDSLIRLFINERQNGRLCANFGPATIHYSHVLYLQIYVPTGTVIVTSHKL